MEGRRKVCTPTEGNVGTSMKDGFIGKSVELNLRCYVVTERLEGTSPTLPRKASIENNSTRTVNRHRWTR